jgi:hypothetical protein
MVSVTTESFGAGALNCGGLTPPNGTGSGWVMLPVVALVQVASTYLTPSAAAASAP